MSDNRIIECMERAQYLLGNLMAVKPGEEVLIVVDPQSPFAKCFFAASIIAGNRAPRHWRLPHFSRPAFGSNAFTLYNGPRRYFATASLTFFLRYCKMGKVSS